MAGIDEIHDPDMRLRRMDPLQTPRVRLQGPLTPRHRHG